ncbi:MAG: SprB repeat-containing protein, partial [Bacteroidales bacterium]|nr:SprB repeat-containing protein [Bacteroidales bacterium]
AAPENIIGSTDVCANSTQVYSVTDRPGSIYNWSIPGGSAIIGDPSAASITVVLGNVSGTIRVTESNIAGCNTIHNSLFVTVKPLPTAVISGGGTICDGSSTDLTVDFAGTGPYTFTYALNGVPQAPISTPVDPYTLTVTQAGTYTLVDVSDATACNSTGFGSAVVTYYPKPTGIISGDATICGSVSTLLTMSFTGTAPYTFTYTDGITPPLTVPNHPGSVYTVLVSPAVTSTYTITALTDGNSCVAAISGSAVITVNQPPALTLTETDLTCNNDNTGAVDLAATGNDPFGFAWTGPLGFTANTEDISGLKAGTYDVTVTDTQGCISTGSATLTEPGALNATLASTDIFCFGLTGSITISAPSGGSGGYEYTIDGGGTWDPSGSFAGLNPGTYDVRMRDVLSPVCDKVLNPALEITGPALLNATVTATDINCFGANNGSIVITGATGGFGIYEYSVDGGSIWQGSGNFINRSPGTYDVRIRDAAYPACVVTLDNAVDILEPPELTATVNSTNIT